ncbi:hypothetical protein, partial [Brevibacterium epidermidis]|uniref:hypothetical protein n=1 Tax=Brevibacterium epidermidis TaxID=1698 RepID=UPI0018E41670
AEEAAAVGIDVEDIAIADDGSDNTGRHESAGRSDHANRADGDNGNDRLGDGETDEKGGDR